MGEVGVVKELHGEQIVVSMKRQEACSKCRACTQGMQEQEMIIKAKNECSAKVGDHVEIMLEAKNFLQATALMYGIPLLALLVGLGLGYVLGNGSELMALTFGFGLLVLSYLGIYKLNPHLKKKTYEPVAINIVNQEQ